VKRLVAAGVLALLVWIAAPEIIPPPRLPSRTMHDGQLVSERDDFQVQRGA
jgi:hypothetical protein